MNTSNTTPPIGPAEHGVEFTERALARVGQPWEHAAVVLLARNADTALAQLATAAQDYREAIDAYLISTTALHRALAAAEALDDLLLEERRRRGR